MIDRILVSYISFLLRIEIAGALMRGSKDLEAQAIMFMYFLLMLRISFLKVNLLCRITPSYLVSSVQVGIVLLRADLYGQMNVLEK